MTKKSHESFANILCDYVPLVIFFIFYKFIPSSNPLITATIALVISSLVAILASYLLTKKVAKVALFSAIILTFFGSATIFLHDDIFIKMKPTVVNLTFSIILFYCYFAKKLWLSNLLGSKIQISEKSWLQLSLRFAVFFTFLAILNEIIWRSSSTDFWVQFKVFGMMPISIIFMLSQMPFLMREMEKFEKQ